MGCFGSVLVNRRNSSNENLSNIPFIHYEIHKKYLKKFKIIERYDYNEYVYKIIEKNKTLILKIHYNINSYYRELNGINNVKNIDNTINLNRCIPFNSETDLFSGGIILYDYIPGVDLFTYITKKNTINSKKIFRNLVKIVYKLHNNHVLHGDLKPENIICKYNNPDKLYIIDFGLSYRCIPKKHYNCIKRFGTIPYMAPELFIGKYCLSSDIWSLGCILYILVFKNTPFSSKKKDYLLILEEIDSYIDLLKERANSKIDMDLFNLIFGMLDTNPITRLNIEEVLNHTWLKI